MGAWSKTQLFFLRHAQEHGETLLAFVKCFPFTPSSSGEWCWPTQEAHHQEAHRDPSWGQESLRLASDPQMALKGMGTPGE